MSRGRTVSSARVAARAVARLLGRRRPASRGCGQVVVLTHERPDGDAVGSCVALASILGAAGCPATAVLGGELPPRFSFLKGARRLRRPEEVRYEPAVAFSLDATDPERHGAAMPLLARAAHTIVIDHHRSNARFGEVNWVDPGASAVGEMIYGLARALRWRLDADACEALYVALITDTGRFSFANTTRAAFRIAGELVGRGVNPERVAEAVYCSRGRGEWELEARLRASLRLEANGRIATVQLAARDFEETSTSPAAAQDFASLPRTIAGVDLGIFLYEIENGARTKVGFRSSRSVDASRLAQRFGGGGHRQASGCVLEGGLEAARPIVVGAAKRFLSNGSNRRRGTR